MSFRQVLDAFLRLVFSNLEEQFSVSQIGVGIVDLLFEDVVEQGEHRVQSIQTGLVENTEIT